MLLAELHSVGAPRAADEEAAGEGGGESEMPGSAAGPAAARAARRHPAQGEIIISLRSTGGAFASTMISIFTSVRPSSVSAGGELYRPAASTVATTTSSCEYSLGSHAMPTSGWSQR